MRKITVLMAAFVCIFLSLGSTLYAYDITGQWNLTADWTAYDPNDPSVVLATGTEYWLHDIVQDNTNNTFIMHNSKTSTHSWTGTFSGAMYTVTGDTFENDTIFGSPENLFGYYPAYPDPTIFNLLDKYELVYEESSNTLHGGGVPYETYLYNSDLEAWELAAICKSVVTLTPVSGSPAPVPEPATIFLLGSGLVGLAGVAKKKRRK